MTWPFFQSFCKNRMIGICTSICYDLNCLIKADSVFLKEADQLRDYHTWVCIIDLDSCIVGKVMIVTSTCSTFVENKLSTGRNHEILLIDTKQSAVFIGCRLLLLLMGMSLLTLTTTTLDITAAFERLMAPLSRIGVPAHELGMILGIALRFLPQFMTELGIIYRAQKSRGAHFSANPFRGGIQSIPRGQYEAAQVLGYTKAQTFFKIILPQMVKRVIPAVTNEVITLVKDTSLASVIGTVEMFTRAKQIVASPNTPGMLALVAAGVFYYVFNYVVAFAMEKWEQALRYYR